MASKTKPLIKNLKDATAALMGAVDLHHEAIAEREAVRKELLASTDITKQLELADKLRLHDQFGVKSTREILQNRATTFVGSVKALETRVAEKEAAGVLKKLNPFRKLSMKRAKNALKAGYAVAKMFS